MRNFVASLIVLAALYLWDQNYNNGKMTDGVRSMWQSISHHVFH
jgi:hypothetical protein